jgi:hypothetical protein
VYNVSALMKPTKRQLTKALGQWDGVTFVILLLKHLVHGDQLQEVCWGSILWYLNLLSLHILRNDEIKVGISHGFPTGCQKHIHA